MPRPVSINLEELLLTALKTSVDMLRFYDIGGKEHTKFLINELHQMCDVHLDTFTDYVMNVLPSKLHFGEPTKLVVDMMTFNNIDLDYGDWRFIQSELGEILTDEWLEKMLNDVVECSSAK